MNHSEYSLKELSGYVSCKQRQNRARCRHHL